MKNLYNICVAALAHLVEQLTCNQQVVGSSPTSGTTLEYEYPHFKIDK